MKYKDGEFEIALKMESGFPVYIVKINGAFYCSCDTMREAVEEIETYKQENKQ